MKWKYLFNALVVMLLCAYSFAANTYEVGGVFIKEGVLAAPDSIVFHLTFEPSDTKDTVVVNPSSATWDTTFTHTATQDERVTALYNIWYGPDMYNVVESILLRIDTTNVTTGFLQLVGDTVQAKMEVVGSLLWGVATFWNACDSCLQIYWPRDGSTPKDSVQTFSSTGTLLMTIIYKHSNVDAVLDSVIVVHEVP